MIVPLYRIQTKNNTCYGIVLSEQFNRKTLLLVRTSDGKPYQKRVVQNHHDDFVRKMMEDFDTDSLNPD